MKVSALLILVLTVYSVSGEMMWERLSGVTVNSPAPRSRHAMGYCNTTQELIVFSGQTSSGLSNETWIYNIPNDLWTQHVGAAPPARLDSYFGVIQGLEIFVVASGIGMGGTEYADVWVFRCDLLTWTQVTEITGNTPPIRYGGHFGTYFSATTKSLWMGGGFTQTTGIYPSRYIDTYRLTFSDVDTAGWELLFANPSSGNQFNPLVPHGRCLQGSAVVSENDLIMYGGCLRGGNGGGPCPAEDVWTFNAGNSEWTQLESCPTPRAWSQMAPLTNRNRSAVLYGGSEKQYPQLISVVEYPIDEVFVVDLDLPSGQRWIRLQVPGMDGSVPGRRFRHAMAAGPNGQVFVYGGENVDSQNFYHGDLWLLSGEVEGTPRHPSNCDRIWFSYAHLHGLMMALSWGILLPLGFLVARYYRMCGKAWFVIHVTLQITGVLLTITAFVMIFPVTSPIPTHPHAIIGLLLMLLTLQQPINGILRPHVKKDVLPTKRRTCWEWFHRIMGISTLVLGFLQVTLGVFLIIPPLGVWVAWILLMFVWFAVFGTHETIKWVHFCLKIRKKRRDPSMEMREKSPTKY